MPAPERLRLDDPELARLLAVRIRNLAPSAADVSARGVILSSISTAAAPARAYSRTVRWTLIGLP